MSVTHRVEGSQLPLSSAFTQRAAISASPAPGQYNDALFVSFATMMPLYLHITFFLPSPHSYSSAAYKHADGKKIDGRRVLVDVERGRTVKGWHPRRLGQLPFFMY